MKRVILLSAALLLTVCSCDKLLDQSPHNAKGVDKMTQDDVLALGIDLCGALEDFERFGLIHRDIKPQNIMLFTDGTIKVMDFGIARFSRIDGKTLSDKTIGSVHYISPEQARGDITDERSDIYSVGAMLYEMLTGHKPFDGENPVAIALKHMQDDLVMPRDIMPPTLSTRMLLE